MYSGNLIARFLEKTSAKSAYLNRTKVEALSDFKEAI